jgi:hypothetical protein
MWATSVMLKQLPKVNSHPIGENSPNPVTLVRTKIFQEDETMRKRE